MKSNRNDIEGRSSAPCSLSSLNEAARRYRKEHFQRANADPTDEDARNGYHYEEGRTRAYAEGLNALADSKAIARARIEALKDHCRKVNPTWAWLMREVLGIVDPQSDVEQNPDNCNTTPGHVASSNISSENAELRDRSGSGTPTQDQPSKLP